MNNFIACSQPQITMSAESQRNHLKAHQRQTHQGSIFADMISALSDGVLEAEIVEDRIIPNNPINLVHVVTFNKCEDHKAAGVKAIHFDIVNGRTETWLYSDENAWKADFEGLSTGALVCQASFLK